MKTGYREQKWGATQALCTQHHQGGQAGPHKPPHVRDELTPHPGASQGACCSHPLLLQQGPRKAWPGFLVWASINFY